MVVVVVVVGGVGVALSAETALNTRPGEGPEDYHDDEPHARARAAVKLFLFMDQVGRVTERRKISLNSRGDPFCTGS